MGSLSASSILFGTTVRSVFLADQPQRAKNLPFLRESTVDVSIVRGTSFTVSAIVSLPRTTGLKPRLFLAVNHHRVVQVQVRIVFPSLSTGQKLIV